MKKYLNEIYKFAGIVAVILILIFVGREIVSDNSFKENNENLSQPQASVAVSSDASLDLQKAKVVRVVDGDTLILNINNKETRVRLIGVNTPESVHPDENKNTHEGKIASDFTKEYLKEGQNVYIETDKEKYDTYGRLLVYLWLNNSVNDTNIDDIEQYMFNAILLKKDYAEIMTIEPNTKYKEYFQKISLEE